MADLNLEAELEKLGKALDRSARFLPPDLRDELTTIRRALKSGIAELLDAAGEGDGGIGLDWDEPDPKAAAEQLCDWSRREDPRRVSRVLEAIGGGHASDLFLIFN